MPIYTTSKGSIIQVLKRRLRMFTSDPHCYWCGVLTQLNIDSRANYATVDHLYSKLHPLRGTKYKGGSDRTALLHVLACAKCNQERGVADQQGRLFIPQIAARREIANHCSAAVNGPIQKQARPKAKIINQPSETTNEVGWTDREGYLRPRSWEEYCSHRNIFIGPSFERPQRPKRSGLATIGEIISAGRGDSEPKPEGFCASLT